jgi:hypothetical protein
MLKVKVYCGVLLEGKIDYVCPGCGIPAAFFVKQDTMCEYCLYMLPDIKTLISSPVIRVSWHLHHPNIRSNS